MRRSRFTEEQMVKILREADKTPIGDVAKKHGILENGKLKKLLAERMLDVEVLKNVNSKKS